MQIDGSVLPTWLFFDATNRQFSGTPTTATSCKFKILKSYILDNIRVFATDPGGSSVNDIFQITVTNNDPTASNSISDQAAVINQDFTFTIPTNTFTDSNSHTITYVSATQTDSSALPSWISFDKDTGVFTGIPDTTGTLSVRITATDGYGGTDPTTDFNIIVNTRPTVTTYSDLTKVPGDSISVSTQFADADSDTLTYTGSFANGTSVESPFSLSSSSGTLTATFSSSNEGRYAVALTATDTKSNSISSTQNVLVNAAPVANQSQLSNQFATDSVAFYYKVSSSALTDTDDLTYTIDGSSTHPAWLSFDDDNLIFYGTGAASPSPNSPILIIKATDTLGQTATVELNITLQTNNAPAVASGKSYSNTSVKHNASYSITFDDDVFEDSDGDSLVLSFLRNSDGSNMPSWWSFNPTTRVASGTVSTSESTFTVRVTATDNKGGSATTTFDLTVSSNNAPTVGTTVSSFIVYQDINFTETFASTAFTDSDGDTLTYYLEGQTSTDTVPQWLSLNSESRLFYGRAGPTASGDYKINLVASDSRGGTASQTITVTVKQSYGIVNILILSIFTILPILSILGYISAIIFMPHESPKFDFDLEEFLNKYDPKRSSQQLLAEEANDKSIIMDNENENDNEIKLDKEE